MMNYILYNVGRTEGLFPGDTQVDFIPYHTFDAPDHETAQHDAAAWLLQQDIEVSRIEQNDTGGWWFSCRDYRQYATGIPQDFELRVARLADT